MPKGPGKLVGCSRMPLARSKFTCMPSLRSCFCSVSCLPEYRLLYRLLSVVSQAVVMGGSSWNCELTAALKGRKHVAPGVSLGTIAIILVQPPKRGVRNTSASFQVVRPAGSWFLRPLRGLAGLVMLIPRFAPGATFFRPLRGLTFQHSLLVDANVRDS